MRPAPKVNGNALFREGESALLHLGGHEGEGVRAGGGEVLLEASFVYEGHVGSEDGVWGFSAEDIDEEGDHSLGDEGIGVRMEIDEAIVLLGIEPDLGLAAFDEVFLIACIIGDWLELLSEADYVFVSLSPVLEKL